MSAVRVCSLVFIAVLSTANAALAQTPTFSKDDYTSFAGARAIATADFNRDGWPDIAHANTNRNTVTVLLNQHGTGFVWVHDVAVGTGPFDMATADFNRDGIPDLAVANADANSISILLGLGDGRFSRGDRAMAPLVNPRGITSADWNNDGTPDLIVTGYQSRSVQVLIGVGDGSFITGPAYISSAVQPQGVATADFNHDGFLDIAVAYASSTGLRILYGTGGATFTTRTIAGDTNLNVVKTGDFNADGWMDVAVASTANSTVGIYAGSPTGLVHTYTYSVGSSPRGIAIADVNDDGALDVMTANRASSTVSILRGDRAHPGAFLSHVDAAAGSGSRDVVVADFNADGRLDLATGNEYAAKATVLSNTTILKRAAYVFGKQVLGAASSTVGGSDAVYTADFNRDGKVDVLTLAHEEPWVMSVLLTGGSNVTLPGTGYPDHFGVADFNADGNPDVFYKTCCPTNAIINVFLGDGRGGFGAPLTTTAAVPGTVVAVADMNRDARADLLMIGTAAANTQQVVHELLGNGDGTFHDAAQVSIETYGQDIRAVDFNRDGRLDVAVVMLNRTLDVFLGDGAGGLSSTPITVTFSAMSDAIDLKLGDLNRDGWLDAVVADQSQIGIALGNGSGFSAPTYLPITSWGWVTHVIYLADLNVDGKLDVVTAGGDFLPGHGDGTFGANEPFDYKGVGLEVVDFTRDGLPDILFGISQGEVGVLVNQRNDVNRPPAVTAADASIAYQVQADEYPPFDVLKAVGTDPDQHALTFEWKDANGTVVSTQRGVSVWKKLPGTYQYTLRVEDGRGGIVTDTVTLTITPTKEIVLHFGEDTVSFAGNWSAAGDATAADGVRAYDANLGAPKVTTPSATPKSFVSMAFIADPTQTYKLWLRMKADGNSWANDSVWVQFSGSADLSSTPKYRTGTTSGLSVSLEECSGCGVSGWGWEDDGWGAINKNGVLLRFPEGGVQYVLIQTREDGVSVDQIVLSSEKYLTARPGLAKKDATILPATYRR